MNDPKRAAAAAIVVVSPEQLAELVRSAVESALAAQREDAVPALLDRSGLARALRVSLGTVNRLRQQGMPGVMIGDSPRFELDRCLAWLRTHRRAQPEEPEASDALQA